MIRAHVDVVAFRAGVTDILPICVAVAPIGLVSGVAAAAVGADVLATIGLSAIVYSGAAQIVLAQLWVDGAPLLVMVATSVVLGLRFLMYSAAIAPHVQAMSPWWRRALAFVLTDQSFALVIRRFGQSSDPRDGASYFLGAGLVLWIAWQVTNMAGFLAGSLIPTSWSLEFAVPLCFIAVVAPQLKRPLPLIAATAAGIAVIVLDGLPMRLNLFVAGLLGIALATFAEVAAERWKTR